MYFERRTDLLFLVWYNRVRYNCLRNPGVGIIINEIYRGTNQQCED